MALSDFILVIKGVEGETADDKFKGDKGIDIESFSWGISNSGSASAVGGAGSGKASFSDLSLMKKVDKSSPKLAYSAANGSHFEEAVLHVRKQGEGQQEYYTVTLTDLLVTSFQASAGGGPEIHESFSLNYAKIKFDYKPQKPDGSLDSAVNFGYDLKAGKKV